MTSQQKRQQIINRYHFRHATKAFDDSKQIEKEDMITILEAARLSPSSFGMEPWQFVVVESEHVKQLIKVHSWGAKAKVEEASAFVLVLARTHEDVRFDSQYVKDHYLHQLHYPKDVFHHMKDVIENFQKHDFQLLDDLRHLDDWSMKQTYIPLANMMSVAAELGIDSCPIEGFDRETFDHLLQTEGVYDDHFTLATMVAFGYRKEEPRPKQRRDFDDVVKWV